MSVWLCVPSARPVADVEKWVGMWRLRGYKIALWRDDGEQIEGVDLTLSGTYPGWPVASNRLIDAVLSQDAACDWTVGGGDDTWPDPNKMADEIARECWDYFYVAAGDKYVNEWRERGGFGSSICPFWQGTFGVMQPCGDDWSDHQGRIIERICGSPWIGREFARRINGGRGPWWSDYRHNWADQELLEVSKRLGVLWQRRDLIHYHDHSRRFGGGWQRHQLGFDRDYVAMKPLYDARQSAGFPGHEPLASLVS